MKRAEAQQTNPVNLVEVEGLEVTYPGQVAAVRGVDLACRPGTVTLVLGPNGAGKTSLARALSGFLSSEQVQVRSRAESFAGRSFLRQQPDCRVREGIVLVPERIKAFATLTVEENLSLVPDGGEEQRRMRERVAALFPALAPLQRKKAGLLSGGERQMLAIGRALLCCPKLLVIDELSLGLAPKITEELLRTVREVSTELGVTIVLIEQAARSALAFADRVCVMRHGEFTWTGAAAEMPEEAAFEAVYMSGSKEPA